MCWYIGGVFTAYMFCNVFIFNSTLITVSFSCAAKWNSTYSLLDFLRFLNRKSHNPYEGDYFYKLISVGGFIEIVTG